MSITYAQYQELQNRLTLLEGGNSQIQITQSREQQQLQQQTQTSKAEVSDITARFERLLNYLEAFFNCGNIRMTDLKRVVGAASSSTTSTNSQTPANQSTASSLEIEALRQDIATLNASMKQQSDRIDALLQTLEHWVNAGSLTFDGLSETVNELTN